MPSKPGKPATARNRCTLGIVFFTLFLDLVGFSIIFPLFPAILDNYLPNGPNDGSLLGQLVAPFFEWAERSGATNPKFMTSILFGGIIGSLYSILQFLCAPIWGAYSDLIGRRKVLLITISGLALSYAVWFFAASFWVLILARVLGGIMGGNLSVATAAVADVTSRKERSGGMAGVGIAFSLGLIIGPAIGGFSSVIDLTEMAPGLAVIGVNPFSFPAGISFILSILNLIWVYHAFKETLPSLSNRETAASPRSDPFNIAQNKIRQTEPILVRETFKIPILRLFQNSSPAIRRTSLIHLIFMLAFSGMEFTLTFIAVERFAFTPVKNALMFVFIGFFIILIQGGIVRPMSGKGHEKCLAIIGGVMGILAFLLLSKSLWLGTFLGALTLMAFSIGLVSPTLNALISLYSKDHEQGQILGIFRSVGSLGRSVGPLLAAFIYFSYGSTGTYLFGAAIIVLPVMLALSLPAN